MKKRWILFFFLLSCQTDKGPEALLLDYVDYRFTTGQKRDWLLSNTSGALNKEINQMSEEAFSRFSDVGHLQKKRIKVNLKDCSESKCSITYTVKYIDKKSRFVIVTKKIAILVNHGDGWKVGDVNNIKSHMESKKEIEIESS